MKKYHKEQEDMKTYVLTLSQKFPATHSKAGQPTLFKHKLLAAINQDGEWNNPKLHTIRANYPLWRERFNQIARGEACLSVRQWTGKPYCSKQVEIARLTAEDGIGVEMLRYDPVDDIKGIKLGDWAVYDRDDYWCTHVHNTTLAHNDGLSTEDWEEWFANPAYDKTQPFAIIQFTKFRYMH